jgi:peptidyl-dipeptidase Dcp
MKKLILPLLAVLMMTACTETNPLLSEWTTPFEIPPFEQVRPEHYMPAYIKAMEVHSAEIDAITSNPEPATFENTIVAYDEAGELLSRVSAVFGSASGVKSNDEIIAIAKELSPLTSAHSNEIRLNESLFARIKEVYDNRDSLGLDSDQMRLLTETYKSFARNGAELPADKKEELKKINTEIAANQLAFGQNLLKETEWTLLVENEEDLAGLSDAQIAAAATRAQQAKKEGWIFGLDNPSIMPFLQSADNRELRIKMLDAYLNRCNNGNEYDNNQVIKNLISLRLQKAQLLGYEDYAAYVLEERMAKNADAVYSLLNQLWTPAIAVAKAELADIEALAAKDGITDVVAADWRYYFEKSMQSKFNISDEELRPYFKLENVRDGIFYVSNKLFGITFEQLDNVPLPHPEAVAFECKEADGTTLGIVFMDMFSRPGEKRGGAWCGGFRSQSYKDGKREIPLVTIVGNFTRSSGDKPALLSTDETNTFFHEFGHALASLLRDVKYRGLGGMTRDFVELPSQIMEHWVFEPEMLKVYAKHYETGEVIPAELIDKLDKAGKYGQGFATVEYLAASLLDMDYHVLKSIPDDLEPMAFEQKVLGDRGILSQIPSRYRSTYFNHTFGGGYTAGYYSYIWAEVLDCDAYEAFVETGDIFNKDVALKYRKEILERPGVDEAMNLYINFRGREPRIEPLLKNRGLN